MAFISAQTIITSISFFHLLLGYLFLANPQSLQDQVLVYILGESMKIPDTQGFTHPSPAFSFLSAILFITATSDLVTLSMPEDVSMLFYWGTQAPLRLTLATVLTMYTYAFSPSVGGSGEAPSPGWYQNGGGFAGLQNRVFFTFVFIEMLAWFWCWVTLREERDGVVDRVAKQMLKDRRN